MTIRSLGLLAGALSALAFASAAGAQTTTGLALKDANSATQNECVYNNGSLLFPCHMSFGWTGSAAHSIAVDASGNQGVNVQNFPTTQPVSAAALPLPAGAATASGVAAVVTALGTPLQSGGNVAVTSSALPTGAATSAGVAAVVTALGTPLQAGGNVAVTASALPTGAATASAQASILAAEASNIVHAAYTTTLGSSATYTGAARDAGAAVSTGVAVSYFNATFYADQAGTAYIDLSDDGTTWTAAVAGTALTAATPLTLTAPLLARYYRARLVNGSTAETVLRVSSAFSRN